MNRAAAQAGASVLGEVIASQRDVYRALLGLADEERGAIVGGDVERLTRLVDEKEQLLDHLRALETERMTALVAIAAATGIDPERATLSDVAAHLPSEPAAALERSGRELRAEALALQEAHEVNAGLLENSRSLVDRWIHYLRSVLVGSLYTQDGSAATASGARSLDRTA